MTKAMIDQFKAARRASAPIVAINTPDQSATMDGITNCYSEAPIARWNIVDGVTSVTLAANSAVAAMNAGEEPAIVTGNPIEALRRLGGLLPGGGIAYYQNAHFFAETTPTDTHKPVIQGIWNLRDKWMKEGKTLVLLANSFQVPPELRNDVVIIDEDLPTDKELIPVVKRGLGRGNAKRVSAKQLAKLVDAVAGLAAFNAEQIIAMAVNPRTRRPDMEQVWEQKIKIIEQTRGLKVYREGVTFDDIGGDENLKSVLRLIARGKYCPRLVVFMDEIEKMLHAAGMDTTGTTTDQLKVLLTSMQNYGWNGLIIYGFPGTGKSELAKAFGSEAGCPTIEADLPSMKNIWLGSSEANMRAFIKTIRGMSNNSPNVFFIATCNSLTDLPPEFQRRFKKGLWWKGLPAGPVRDKIWDIYFRKFHIPAQDRDKPNDDGWNGAEIRLCNENAHEYGCSLREAAANMTIMSKAMGEEIEARLMAASGKYLDAERPGVYHYTPVVKKTTFMKKLKGE